MSKHSKRYFVVAIDTDDEREAIHTAWRLKAKFVFDAEKQEIATIVTDASGSRLIVYPDNERSEVSGQGPKRTLPEVSEV